MQARSSVFAAVLGVLDVVLGALFGFLGCGSSAPILLHPKMPNVSGAQCPVYRSPFTLTRVEDKRGYADDRNVGFTQTGLSNVKASLETERPTVSFGEPHGLIFRRQDFRLFYTGGLFIMAGNMETMADTKGLDAGVEALTFGPERRALLHTLVRLPAE